MTNARNTVLYPRITSNLKKRVYEHKTKVVKDFTQKYRVNVPVYYEVCSRANKAILREKQIKGGSRKKKLDLINSLNNSWKDLSEDLW
jgi:putative endonuclease